jgi:hypothetical protein
LTVTDPEKIVGVIVTLFVLLQPSVAIGWNWRRYARAPVQLDRLSVAVLALTTASYIFVWIGGVIYRPLLGADYSDRLFVTIASNLALAVALTLVVAIRRGPWRQRVCLSSSPALVAFAWFYVLALNSAV